ncbi:MAG: hypothetical protein M3126_00670 [Candidatus Eremiobacteraeota bacterium]|nr:hypothetical protein [Candidatus Eremiobacteraeota bacterium]
MRNIAAPPLDHLLALSDDTGVIQHATHDIPNRSTGYCSDDVSRAFMVVLAKLELDPRNETAAKLASVYLAFLHDAQMEDGWFHNFMSFDRRWLDDRGTEDSFGRTVWSLGFGMRYGNRESWKTVCGRLLENAIPRFGDLRYLRSIAYAVIGISHAFASGSADEAMCRETVRPLADALKTAYLANRDTGWQWFENEMTYDNARLCEAVLRAGLLLRDDELIAVGLRTFAFYERTVMEDGMFIPIGNNGWYVRGGRRARYGQQPLEVASMVDAALIAHDCTGDPAFVATARLAFEWFYGKNTSGVQMVDRGGCCDGIDAGGANPNMGAESTLAYLASACALADRPAKALTIAR